MDLREKMNSLKTYIKTDAFLNKTYEEQLLYFHLWADSKDNGITVKTRAIQRMLGVKDEVLDLLIEDHDIQFDDEKKLICKLYDV